MKGQYQQGQHSGMLTIMDVRTKQDWQSDVVEELYSTKKPPVNEGNELPTENRRSVFLNPKRYKRYEIRLNTLVIHEN